MDSKKPVSIHCIFHASSLYAWKVCLWDSFLSQKWKIEIAKLDKHAEFSHIAILSNMPSSWFNEYYYSDTFFNLLFLHFPNPIIYIYIYISNLEIHAFEYAILFKENVK